MSDGSLPTVLPVTSPIEAVRAARHAGNLNTDYGLKAECNRNIPHFVFCSTAIAFVALSPHRRYSPWIQIRPDKGQKTLQKGTARAGWSSGGDGI